MTCNRCGGELPPALSLCPACGAPVGGPAPHILSSRPSFSIAPTVPAGPAARSGKAIASLACGLLAFITPAAIVAVVLGHVSLSEIKKSGGRLTGRGMAIAGLVLGYLSLVTVPVMIVGIIRSMGQASFENIGGNQITASNSVKYVVQAEQSYIATHAHQQYPCDFQTLIDAKLLESEVVRTAYHGYVMGLENCGARVARGDPGHFVVVARPVQPGKTGLVNFCSDESGKVKYIGVDAGDCMQSGKLWEDDADKTSD